MIKRKLFYVIASFSLIIQIIFTSSFVRAGDIPQDARRHMQRGLTAIKMATSVSDYKEAIREFEQAKQLAPDWPDVYYNLALVQEKVGGHIKVYKSARKNLQKYLGFDISEEDRINAQKLLSKIEGKIGIIRDERTLVGIWYPVTSNDLFAEPRIEIRAGRNGGLVARALACKSAMNPEVLGSNAYKNGPFVPVEIIKDETEEIYAMPEMSLKIPATVYWEWKKYPPYWYEDCQEKASFTLLRLSEDKIEGTVHISGKVVTGRGPEKRDTKEHFIFKKEKSNHGAQY